MTAFNTVKLQIAALIKAGLGDSVDVYSEAIKPNNFTNASNKKRVNIHYVTTDFDKSKSDEGQNVVGVNIFNIDCYAQSPGSNTQHGNHAAVSAVQDLARQILTLLMSGSKYLGLQGLVWERFVNKIEQQFTDEVLTEPVAMNRLVLQVTFTESATEPEPVILEGMDLCVVEKDDGQILLEMIVEN